MRNRQHSFVEIPLGDEIRPYKMNSISARAVPPPRSIYHRSRRMRPFRSIVQRDLLRFRLRHLFLVILSTFIIGTGWITCYQNNLAIEPLGGDVWVELGHCGLSTAKYV